MSNSKLGSDQKIVKAELKRVKCSTSTTLEWTIADFSSLIGRKILTIESQPFSIRCGRIEALFQLSVQINKEKDRVGMFLENLSLCEVDVKFQVRVIHKTGAEIYKSGFEEHKFTPESSSWGFPQIFSIEDLLQNRFPKLALDLTVFNPQETIEGYDGIGLKKCLEKLWKDGVSFSPTIYEQFFCTKMFFEAFIYVQLCFVIICLKKNGAKAAHKMLVKLTTGCCRFQDHLQWKRIPLPQSYFGC